MPIPHWRPDSGSVIIYPHCVVEGKILNLNNSIENLFKKVSDSMPGVKIQIWKTNTFCSEVKGQWNRIITITIDEWKYHYMIRRDKGFNSTYGCPFYNNEYPKEAPLTIEQIGDEKFKIFESLVFVILGSSCKKIKYFPT